MTTRQSTITCPHCGQKTTEAMPLNACIWLWTCPGCHRELKPKKGDCCVYCSYGSTPCPPKQENTTCCPPDKS
ncbi:MAG: GDCCVxC domain-containing (seleno)protein [Pseudomonadota bacterium]|nr:GDCCVxC domain-containing (seleno)protein [Pseudomonadota bacterium]